MTSRAILDFDLGDIGRQWVRRCLEGCREGGVCLGPLLLPELNLEAGQAVVLGSHGEPPHGDVERLWESVAHLDVLDLHDSAAAVLGLLRSLDSAAGGVTVIVENDLLLPHHKQTSILLKAKKALVVSGTVYHIREVSGLGKTDDVIEMLSEGTGYPFSAFIMQSDTARNFVGLMERKEVSSLVSALLGTLHTVYDCEGYLAWVRRLEINV